MKSEKEKRSATQRWLRWFAGRNEALMFTLSLAFLVCLAVLVVIWVDMPGLQERAKSITQSAGDGNAQVEQADTALSDPARLGVIMVTIMAGIWCAVLAEAIVHWVTRPWNTAMRPHHRHSAIVCLCPALRMGARSPEMHGRIWLPGMGWRVAGRRLQRQLERAFSVPMMVIALLIMPILITEFFLKDQVAAYGWLRILLHVGTGVIWFAFVAEFILMVSIAEKKLAYCKRHWIDLAIILLPLLSFLRSLSLVRATRLAKLMRIQQLTKLARAYRLRGTAIKAFRVLVLFDLTDRLLSGSDEKRIARMEREVADLEKQSRLLRQRIAKLKMKTVEPENGA